MLVSTAQRTMGTNAITIGKVGGIDVYHPLYYRAERWVGQTVCAYHINGSMYTGQLLSVNPRGIYIMQQAVRPIAATDDKQTIAAGNVELIYSPAAFFGFGALTGLTLGAAAGGLLW